MRLSVKNYRILKIKKYFKINQLFFFINGVNRNSINLLLIKQKLKTIGFNYYTILNGASIKVLNVSIYFTICSTLTGFTFLIKPLQKTFFFKQTILNTFHQLFVKLLLIKLNNKLYTAKFLKKTYSLKYTQTKLLLYQFNLALIKNKYKLFK
jgi:hypothetical protein